MIGVSDEVVLVERGAQRAHAPVHHVARRDGVGTRGGLGDGGAGEQLERRVVVDDAVGAQHAAVAVARVLAQAEVGDHQQVGVLGLDRARGELDDALVVPRARALLVLARREPEQQHGRDPERGGLAGLLHRVADREVVDPRHRRDRRPAVGAVHDEHRVDEVPRGQLRLAHEVADAGGGTEAAQAGGGEGHGADGSRGCGSSRRAARDRAPARRRTRPEGIPLVFRVVEDGPGGDRRGRSRRAVAGRRLGEATQRDRVRSRRTPASARRDAAAA